MSITIGLARRLDMGDGYGGHEWWERPTWQDTESLIQPLADFRCSHCHERRPGCERRVWRRRVGGVPGEQEGAAVCFLCARLAQLVWIFERPWGGERKPWPGNEPRKEDYRP
jgi:hypothetical protein